LSALVSRIVSRWKTIIEKYHLESNEWLQGRYEICKSWIPVYFRDIWLGGILWTTSRPESAISFFNHFIGRKLALVEFCIRFNTTLKCQRQEELMDDNTSQYTQPTLFTSWEIEKHVGFVYTHEI
jgi:hypothetical protein